MNILYLGSSGPNSTSYHRSQALVRIGHNVIIKDPYKSLDDLNNSSLIGKFHFKTGYTFLQKKLEKWLKTNLDVPQKIDVIWVNGGELFGKKSLNILKVLFQAPIVLYNNDDPTGGRDGHRFRILLKTIPMYDLCVVMRDQNVEEYKKNGAKKVLRVTMSYDEIVHRPLSSQNDISEKFKSDVAFIGTWMRHEKRDEFLLTLIERGIPVSIWGDRWQKSSFWHKLKPYYRGGALGGQDYVAAIQGAKICIGMLSKGNRDLHTQRSFEIPYIGSLFCAESTSEHLSMYKNGVEAVFWHDAIECANICKDLLSSESTIEEIRQNGMARVRENKVGNEDVCEKILETLLAK